MAYCGWEINVSKPTIFQTGEVRIEYYDQANIRITRQDNGQTVEMSRSEWEFLIRSAAIANWPTVTPERVQEIINEVTGN